MDDIGKDPNDIAYRTLLNNDEWYNRFKGLYVTFVDGKLVDQGSDKPSQIKRIMETYKGKSKLFTLVDRIEPEIDIATPFLD